MHTRSSSMMFLWVLALLCGVKSFAACDNCMRPQVIQFDARVIPARPSDSTDPQLVAKILEWRNLFWASAGVKGYLSSEDPTRECFTRLDGSFWTGGDTASHSLKFGDEWSNLPPSAGKAGGDYLVTGSVDGANGAYTLEAQLQVSKTRETVAKSTKAFSASDEPMTVGKVAASALGPIVDKIRAFEKTKRATGDPYALWPTAELHPAKTELKEGESVEVEVWLYDCDGTIATSPLANRPVQISVTNGAVSEATVTTGNDGKAKFTFTAGSKPSEALLTALYPFKLASEHESVSNPGYAVLRIHEIPATLWKLQGSMVLKHTYEETKRSNYDKISEGGFSSSVVAEQFAVSGVLRNVTKDSLTLFKSDTAPVKLSVVGTHTEDEISRGYFQAPPSWSKRQSYQTVHCVPVPSADFTPGMDFHYFYEPGASRKASGSFSLSGIAIEGPAITTGTDCNSEDGCKDISQNDVATDELSVWIPVPESLSEQIRDTSYVDMAGIQVLERFSNTVGYADGVFRIESRTFEKNVKNGEGTVANTGYTSTTDKRYSFTLTRIGEENGTYRIPQGRSRLAKGILGASVTLDHHGWTVDFQAESEGLLQVKLLDLNGRILSQDSRLVAKGLRSERFARSNFGNRIFLSELTFTPAQGAPSRLIQRHTTLACHPGAK
ncbi:MAG: Ig-like domain-containing protein [Fibrobacteres bacterium]|nr:Ig-like domain-containing protein [Fibrobacterota bacterium]